MEKEAAQKLININGHKVGKEVVILGSGDIGMIMARRLSLGGAKVKAVIEIMPYLAGLTRNKLQCLDDFAAIVFFFIHFNRYSYIFFYFIKIYINRARGNSPCRAHFL